MSEASVIGVGVDAVDLPTFAAQLEEPGTRFAGVFSATERRQARERGSGEPARHLGVRWAAKEAVVKAWSAALYGRPPVIDPDRLVWSEIETVSDAWGRPSIRLSGAVAAAVAESVSPACDWQVSLTHDGATAIAFVVLSRGRDG